MTNTIGFYNKTWTRDSNVSSGFSKLKPVTQDILLGYERELMIVTRGFGLVKFAIFH